MLGVVLALCYLQAFVASVPDDAVLLQSSHSEEKPHHRAAHTRTHRKKQPNSAKQLYAPGGHMWGPCSEAQKHSNWKPVGTNCLRKNLDYVKVHKTGSSTVGGVMRRISARHGLFGVSTSHIDRADNQFFEPVVMPNHDSEQKKKKLMKTLAATNPWMHVTWVREPIARALSEFYHEKVTRLGRGVSEGRTRSWWQVAWDSLTAQSKQIGSNGNAASIINYLKANPGSFEVDYISPGVKRNPDELLGYYDFVGITERTDESLLVMKHVLNLPSLCDIMYVSAKNSSANQADPQSGKRFAKTVPLSQQPNDVQNFAGSTEFQKKMSPDVDFYAAANAKLDKRINTIGADKFSQELSVFKGLLSKARAECRQDQRCYWNDNGCGYQCLDQVCDRSNM